MYKWPYVPEGPGISKQLNYLSIEASRERIKLEK